MTKVTHIPENHHYSMLITKEKNNNFHIELKDLDPKTNYKTPLKSVKFKSPQIPSIYQAVKKYLQD